jgi:hypothetical protein
VEAAPTVAVVEAAPTVAVVEAVATRAVDLAAVRMLVLRARLPGAAVHMQVLPVRAEAITAAVIGGTLSTVVLRREEIRRTAPTTQIRAANITPLETIRGRIRPLRQDARRDM